MTNMTIFEPGQMESPDNESVTEPAGSNARKALIVAGGVGAVALLAFGGYTLFGGGGSDPVAAPPVASRARASATPTPSASAPAAVLPAAKTSHVFRDPFKPLLSAKGAAVATGVPVAKVPVTVVASPKVQAPVGGSNAVPTSAPVPPKPVVKVKLISVDAADTVGQVAVNGVASPAPIGVAFAEKFKALRYSEGNCGTFQYGDERFDLCEGQTATMR